MNSKIPLRFFVITFLWSWLLWSPFVLVHFDIYDIRIDLRSGLIFTALFLGAFGPALGAFFSVWSLQGKAQLGEFLKSFLSLKFGWKVWATIFVVLGAINFMAWFIPELWNFNRLYMLLPNIYVFPIVWLFMIFLGGGQEEIGWRGYIMPLLESKYGLYLGNIILGAVWAIWHLPLYFISETNQNYMPFPAFLIGLIGLSFFLSWVIKASDGKPFSGLIAHGTANAFISIFPVFIREDNDLQLRFWIYQILILLVGIIFLMTLKRRLKNSQQRVFQS